MSNKRSKKLLEEVFPLDIIREVEKWPVLYSRECPERINSRFRSRVWERVAAALLPRWDTYSQQEKEIKTIDLSKRWRNLRDAFKRHIEVTRKEGVNAKRKEYVYFKYMMFLLPHVLSPDERTPTEPGPASARDRPTTRTRRAGSESGDDIDEDKHFLLSLVPSFKKMTEDEKLSVKMDILRTIREVRNKRRRTRVTSSTSADMHYLFMEPGEAGDADDAGGAEHISDVKIESEELTHDAATHRLHTLTSDTD